MASLLPLIQELLPMILPSSVHIAKAEAIRAPSPSRLQGEDALALGVENAEVAKLRQHGQAWPGQNDGPETANVATERNGNGESTRNGASVNLGRRTANRTSDFELDDDEGYGNEEDFDSEEEAPAWSRKRGMAHIPADSSRRVQAQNGSQHREADFEGGVTMHDAIVNKTGRMCASVLTVKPRCSTIVFHNGEQEAIMYAVSGRAVLATVPEDEDAQYNGDEDADSVTTRGPPPNRNIIGPGDFAFVPAWTEHQVINESDDVDVVWVVVHSGAEPTVVPLREWGGPEARF